MHLVLRKRCYNVPSTKILLATLDTLEEAIVGRLLLEVLIPKKSSSLAREDSGNPRKGIRDTPDGHTDTPLDRKAAPGDSLVSRSLGLQLRGSSGGVHADVDLGVDNVDVQNSEAAEDSFECCLSGQDTSGRGNLLGKVSLKANAVNVHTVALDELNNALGSEGLVAIVLKVVVVVEQLRLGAGLLGELESKRDLFKTYVSHTIVIFQCPLAVVKKPREQLAIIVEAQLIAVLFRKGEGVRHTKASPMVS